MARTRRNRLIVGETIAQLASLRDATIDLVCLDIVRALGKGEKSESGSGHPRQLDLFDHEPALRTPLTLPDADGECAWDERLATCIRHCYRVLKTTGNCYVQSTPEHESMVREQLDQVFGRPNFRNQIVWKQSRQMRDPNRPFAHAHEILLLYGKSQSSTANPVRDIRSQNPQRQYRFIDKATKRRYALADCVNPRPRGPEFTFRWKGHLRTWRWTRKEMERLEAEGRLAHTRSGLPRYKRFLDEVTLVRAGSVWTDPPILRAQGEGAGHVEVPESLVTRMIVASTNIGDTVLDPFCGDGPTIVAAQRLGRRWIGIHETHFGIAKTRARLRSAFGADVPLVYSVEGSPRSVGQATALLHNDPFQFVSWTLGEMGVMPLVRRGRSDDGIDGTVVFDDAKTGRQQVIFLVRSTLSRDFLRDLEQLRIRHGAAIAVAITLQDLALTLKRQLASTTTLRTDSGRVARLQVLSVRDILLGLRACYPGSEMSPLRRPGVTRLGHKRPRTGTAG